MKLKIILLSIAAITTLGACGENEKQLPSQITDDVMEDNQAKKSTVEPLKKRLLTIARYLLILAYSAELMAAKHDYIIYKRNV